MNNFSKAFDKVPHNGLLYKLFKCGFDDITLQWLKFSWEQKTKCSSRRRAFAISSGKIRCTPRISAGPLIFLIFVNDFPYYVKSRVHLFADDTVIYLTIKSESNCWQLQDDFHSLEKWESDWCIEFNPSKCNIIRVTCRRTPFKFQYKQGHGKVLLHDLHWNDHVN